MRPVTDLQRRVAPFEVVTDMVPAGVAAPEDRGKRGAPLGAAGLPGRRPADGPEQTIPDISRPLNSPPSMPSAATVPGSHL